MRKFIVSVFCLFCLCSCGGDDDSKKIVPNSGLASAFAVNRACSFTVLDYKFMSSTNNPSLGNAPEGQKYVFVRMLWQNTSPNRATPAFTPTSTINSIQIIDSKTQKTFNLSVSPLYDSIDTLNTKENKKIDSGENLTAWVMGLIPQDLAAPFYLKITPSAGNTMILELK